MSYAVGVALVVGAISGIAFLCGYALRRWWLSLIPLALAGLAVGSVALSPSDDGDLPPEGQVVLAILFFGGPAVIAVASVLAGVFVGRARARQS